MPVLKIADLTAHPKNEYFFDDIQGDGWNDLLQSVRTSGVTNAITVTKDGVIISGHQRVRACKLLGIEEIPAHVVEYTPEEQEKQKDVKDLIESNLKQRVPGNSNPVKLGRCFAFLEEYYNVKQGKKPNNSVFKTQKELAEENGISADTMQNYKRLASSIPEMQELLNTGKVTPTTALAIMRQLSEEEQREFAQQVADEKKVSAKVAEEYIATLKAQSKREARQEFEAELKALRQTNKVLKEQAEKTATVVAPEDYQQMKSKARSYDSEVARLNNKINQVYEEKRKLQDQIDDLKQVTQEGLETGNLSENVFYFCTLANNFVGNAGGLVWLTSRINDMPNRERELFLKAAQALRDFSQVFTQNMERMEYGESDAVISGRELPSLPD